MDLDRAGCQCLCVSRVDHLYGVCNEADMHDARRRRTLPQPEKYTALCAQALEVGMTRWAIFAVIVEAVWDAGDGKHPLIEGDRTVDVTDGKKDVIKHGHISQIL
jgi:hypothetical protein